MPDLSLIEKFLKLFKVLPGFISFSKTEIYRSLALISVCQFRVEANGLSISYPSLLISRGITLKQYIAFAIVGSPYFFG